MLSTKISQLPYYSLPPPPFLMGSMPDQSMQDLWTKWHGDRLFSSTSLFLCQYHSTNAPYTSSGQTDEAWGPSKKQCLFGNLGALDRKAFKVISCYSRQFFAVGYLETVTFFRHHGDIAHNVASWSGVTEFCGSFVPLRVVTGPPPAGRELNSVAATRTEF